VSATPRWHERSGRLADVVARAELDCLLVSRLVNVHYLTGYTGSNGVALVGPQLRAFITDFRYREQAVQEVDSTYDRRIAESTELLDGVGAALGLGETRLGFEGDHLFGPSARNAA
jgi:Xaa-Pro aminopeptidase